MNTSKFVLSGGVLVALALPAITLAQSTPPQVVKPPIAQAWIDVATFSGFSMGPGGPGGPGGAGGMMGSVMSGMMGGSQAAQAAFGYTVSGPAGRWMDVTLYTSRNPNLTEGLQAVPAVTTLAPTLKLQSPERPKPVPPGDDEPVQSEIPKLEGKFLLYWGCSETVRPGQPKVLDLSTATVSDYGKFFEARRATRTGTHAAAGRPVWPNKVDRRALPLTASIVGEHGFTGQGVPDGFKFKIPPAQDLMPALNLKQTDSGKAVQFQWNAIPTARAYFLSSMGAREGEKMTMVIWTSSELPDMGFGLLDYQTNSAVDKWLKEKVLLPPTTTTCAAPKESLTEGTMVRVIAYGTELNLAQPPRPTDPKIAWEPDWNLKVRVKSMTSTMIGMPDMGGTPGAPEDDATPADATDETPADEQQPKKKKSPFDAMKDAVKQIPGM
jgi:hypothetical protein